MDALSRSILIMVNVLLGIHIKSQAPQGAIKDQFASCGFLILRDNFARVGRAGYSARGMLMYGAGQS